MDEATAMQSLIAALRPEPVRRAGSMLFATVVVGALSHPAEQSQCTAHLGFDIGYRIIIRRRHCLRSQSHSSQRKIGWRFVVVGHSGSPGYREDVFRFHSSRIFTGGKRKPAGAHGEIATTFRFTLIARRANVNQT
ncbi:MAG: hypothetical protein WCI94_10785 [Rhodospirillales bacterium]